MQSVDKNYVIIREPKGLTDRAIWLVPLLNPEGTIKYVRVNEFIQSALLTVSGEHVQLKPGLEEKGWEFLAVAMREEGLAAAWPRFQKWMLDGPMGTEGGQVSPWPDKYLPSRVKQRRAKALAERPVLDEIVIPELDESDPSPTKRPRKE